MPLRRQKHKHLAHSTHHHQAHHHASGIIKSKEKSMRVDMKKWIVGIAGAALVALAVLIAVWSVQAPRQASVGQPLQFTTIDPTALPPGAPLGAVTADALPPSFPKGLVLGTGAVMTVLNGLPSTSTTPKAAPSNEYTLSWTATSSPSSLLTAYQAYFSQNKWALFAQSSTAAVAYIEASMASSTALVILSPQGSSTMIMLDYVSR